MNNSEQRTLDTLKQLSRIHNGNPFTVRLPSDYSLSALKHLGWIDYEKKGMDFVVTLKGES